MRRGFHPLGKGFGLRATIRRAEQFRVDDDSGHAVKNGIGTGL